MKKLLFIFALVFIAAPAWAQPVATPTQKFAIDYVAADIATYQVTRFERQVDTGAFVDVGLPAPTNDASTPAGHNTYKFDIPAMTPGNHAVTFRACNVAGCSSPLALSFTLVIIPPPVVNLRIVSGNN